MKTLASIPQIIAGILAMFFAIMGVRWTYPVLDFLFDLTWEKPIMRTVSILIMWLMYFFITFILTWHVFFKPVIPETTKGEKT